ncbi:Pr6Pr family membrane protein [Sphingomonas sp.]|uniref:Pr6Pr family membrane protein n=1 Tax=Sphingomonas sp. TaxID=28214 RepID=UPI00286A5EE7|nr:Pr6Pr family membrane protein [Sphingomonas sp.]
MRIRGIAAFIALFGWAALVLQLALIIGNLGPALGLWRYFGFFTVLINIGAAAVATAMALGSRGPLAGARARLMAATSIALVGITYSLALRALWHPTGLQKVADMALHDAMPLLFITLWAVAPHPRLKWREVGWALLPPALYAAYALARGAIDGWYAYWFLNPAEQSAGALIASVAVLLCAVAIIAAALIVVDRWLGRKE